MTMTDMHACPVAGCDTFPYDTLDELVAHMHADHIAAAPAAAPAPATPAPAPAPAPGWNSMPAPRRTPTEPLPNARWRKVGDDWFIRGPLATLSGATTVTVKKASGELTQVDIDPATVTPDTRTRYDRHEMAIARPAPKPETSTGPVPEGFHILDGTVYKVQRSGAGNLYAKRLVPSTTGKKGRFEYAPGEVKALSAATHVADAEAAAAAGRRFGFCIRCGALLTDPKSIDRGIGPICAEKF